MSGDKYECPQEVMDTVQGLSMDDALAVRLAEDLISQRYTEEIKSEVSEMMSVLSKRDRSQLVALVVKFPAVSVLQLYNQMLEWKQNAQSEEV